MLKATIALERKVTGERTNTGAILFLYEFVPLAAPPRKIFPKLADVSGVHSFSGRTVNQ